MKDTYEAFGMGEGRQREEGDESDSPHDEGSVEFGKRCWKQRERLLSRLAIIIGDALLPVGITSDPLVGLGLNEWMCSKERKKRAVHD